MMNKRRLGKIKWLLFLTTSSLVAIMISYPFLVEKPFDTEIFFVPPKVEVGGVVIKGVEMFNNKNEKIPFSLQSESMQRDAYDHDKTNMLKPTGQITLGNGRDILVLAEKASTDQNTKKLTLNDGVVIEIPDEEFLILTNMLVYNWGEQIFFNETPVDGHAGNISFYSDSLEIIDQGNYIKFNGQAKLTIGKAS